jgi:asparagine synthase (glutamine-hydrolysing)
MAELASQPVKTFSIGFPEQEYSELPYARQAARYFGTDHHEYVLQPDAVKILDKLVTHFGEPFADSSALPTWYLSQLTRESVTVALTGDGGDELFGGYRWYQSSVLLETALFIPQSAAKVISRLAKWTGLRALRSIGNGAALVALSSMERYAAQRQILTYPMKELLYTREFLSQADNQAQNWLADQYKQMEADDALNKAMMADLSTYMAEDLLVKVDRTSMAHSLECRSPFLDTDLAEWVIRLPSLYKIQVNRFGLPTRNGGKWLLREAVRNRLPPGFLNRPKQGFSVPLEYWFRNGLKEITADRVLHGSLTDLKLFKPAGLKQITEAHFNGQTNYAPAVWALLVLAVWVDIFS